MVAVKPGLPRVWVCPYSSPIPNQTKKKITTISKSRGKNIAGLHVPTSMRKKEFTPCEWSVCCCRIQNIGLCQHLGTWATCKCWKLAPALSTIRFDSPTVYDIAGASGDRNCVVLNNIHIDIMDYIYPATCTDEDFRKMWVEFEWENKVRDLSVLSLLWSYNIHTLSKGHTLILIGCDVNVLFVAMST